MERPEQNSVVERKHQHLLNEARALYLQARVPIHFWGECILIATFLIHRTPSSILKNKSPCSLLHKSPVDYNFLRVFGNCTLPSHRSKFDPTARAYVFIGYPLGIKGYRLYDTMSKSFLISRDVVFYENVFPFHFSEI